MVTNICYFAEINPTSWTSDSFSFTWHSAKKTEQIVIMRRDTYTKFVKVMDPGSGVQALDRDQ